MNFYIVPEHIASANQNRREGAKGLYFVQDLQGRYVVGTEVAPLWPDIDWQSMPVEELSMDDFPQPEEE